jgi:hypothetical protein
MLMNFQGEIVSSKHHSTEDYAMQLAVMLSEESTGSSCQLD